MHNWLLDDSTILGQKYFQIDDWVEFGFSVVDLTV